MKYKNYHSFPKYSEGDKVYFGEIDGVRDMPLITAPNQEEYERQFHEAVDAYILDVTRKAPKRDARTYIALAVIIAVVVMFLTCPKREQHVNKISEKVVSALSEEYEDYAFLSALTGGRITTAYLSSLITVGNYYLFSVGKMKEDNKSVVCSLGILGCVITVPEKQIRECVRESNSYFN